MAFIQITPSELRLGLFIKLECSWWNHPFAKNKFKLTSNQEIRTIRAIKKAQVFYDPDLSDPEPEPADVPSAGSNDVVEEQSVCQEGPQISEEEFLQKQIQACEQHTAELQKAAYVYQQVIAQAKIGMKRISDGHVAGLKSLDQVLGTIAHALTKQDSATALIDILASAETDDPFLAHALNVCVVSQLVGHEYQFSEDQLYALGMAALLHDIGKYNFPPSLRNKRFGLTKAEQQEYLLHPQLGKEILKRFGAIPALTVEAVSQHHERMNGSGFPLGLAEKEIGLFAKIIMAADEYDHLCHRSDSAKNFPPAEALSYLYDEYVVNNLMMVSDQIKNICEGGMPAAQVREADEPVGEDGQSLQFEKAQFSEEVIVLMVRALGVYPPGTVVELTNGLLGLVSSVNLEERTKPCVMMYVKGVPRKDARLIDLAKESDVSIVHSVRPQVIPKEVHEYFFSSRV